MGKSIKTKFGVKDIAAAAGVSIGTVDRVLNNRGRVKKETAEKIMAIISEMGYKPNVYARSLSSKKTTRIAIVIPDSSDNNPYWKKPVFGIEKASEELAGFNIEIVYEYFDASNEKSFMDVLKRICEEKLDGIVLNPVFKSASLHFISIFNTQNIPYVLIDINIKGVGKLAFFGQNAEQSGLVAAKLMKSSLVKSSNILIVKQSKNKVFSQHIESRVDGFLKFFKNYQDEFGASINIIEIDLNDDSEPDYSIAKAFSEFGSFHGIFIPNSRVYKAADFLLKNGKKDIVTIGYDLIEQNIRHLELGTISYLINQKPEEQAYNSIMALFGHLISKNEVEKTTYSPIDIIIKENIEYYK